MATIKLRATVWLALALSLFVPMAAGGCQYEAQFKEKVRPLSLSFAVTYQDRGSEVLVTYSVPPPSPGKVYVMWVYNQGRTQISKLGVVPAGVDNTVKGSANFPIFGVVISEEANENVTRMEGTGVIELTLYEENFGPSAGGAPTPVPRR
jgi:hypothetical protein